MIELDVQLTRDAEVVVIHDWTLARTTDGRGRVASHTLSELRRLDAGAWFAPAYRGERIPTLREVLDAVALPVNVELKAQGDDGLEDRTLAAVREAGAVARVVFSSFDAASLVRMRRRAANVDIAVLWSRRRLTMAIELADGVGATALHIRKGAVVPGEVRAARARGLGVRVWTVNEPGESAGLAALGVGAVFTDFPERFLQNGRA
jgi:glycerophosphoryl diester phosphodiesterase